MFSSDRFRPNFRLIWIDANAKKNPSECQNILEKLRAVINDVYLFSNISESIRFVDKLKNDKVLIVSSGTFGEEIVQRLHSFDQVEAFYIFCYNVDRHRFWTKHWRKIIAVDNRIEPICCSIAKLVKTTTENVCSLNFLPTRKNVEVKFDENQLNSSFMYTQLLKKILIGLEYDVRNRGEFLELCRKIFRENPIESKIVDEFQRNYEMSRAIWWYTKNCFLYQMLNQSLRFVQVETMIDMAFFLHDLHRNVERLHREQFVNCSTNNDSLTLYRGQSVTQQEFNEIENSSGALISFNSFLSTSRNRSVALNRVEELTMLNPNFVGILFVLKIDPRLSKTPFADIQKESFYGIEEEVLFSMHTVFRIGQIRLYDQQKTTRRIFQIDLTLTDDDDPELRRLTREIDDEIEGNSGYERLTALLIRMGEITLAERLCLKYLAEKPDQRSKSIFFHQLGRIENERENFHLALHHLTQALTIEHRISSPENLHLARLYNSFGISYSKMNDSFNALLFYKKTLEIFLKISSDRPDRLVTAYNNIAGTHRMANDYTKAMEFYTKALRMCETNLSAHHPYLAICYFNIAVVQQDTGDRIQSRLGYEKALKIWKRSLPSNHPNIRLVVERLNELK